MSMTSTWRAPNRHNDPLSRAAECLGVSWQWLCRQREDAPADADVWHLRHHWRVMKSDLLAQLLAGDYRLSPMQVIKSGTESKAIWGARDALVLKWVALQIAPLLPLHERCEHVKGQGGGAVSIARLSSALQQGGHPWVLRTDVKGYYANIDKALLLGQVDAHVHHPVLRDLVHQYVHYTVEYGGEFHTPVKGISRGCALSPLMGALHLTGMDVHFGSQEQIVYARYMDDIVILAKTRWQLRKQVRHLNRSLEEKGLRQHPDKTFIGRTVKGFDWMGAWLEPQGVTDIAPRAKANHREKVRRLYERAWRWREPKAVTRRRVSNYRWRWTIWAAAILASGQLAHATTLEAVVQGGRAGIVGSTSYVSSTLGPAPLGPSGGRNMLSVGFPAITNLPDRCVSLDFGGGAGTAIGSSGVNGYQLLGGPTAGGVLLVDGTGSWSRRTQTGITVQGQVVYTAGAWRDTWTPIAAFRDNPRGMLASDPNGLLFNYLTCPSPVHVVINDPTLDTTYARSSSLHVRFLIDAPNGGLSPGSYHLAGPLYHLDKDTSVAGSLSRELLSNINITVANYSCSLNLDKNTLPLHYQGGVAPLAATVTCNDGTPTSSVPYNAVLTALAVGGSTSGASGRELHPPGSPGTLNVQGQWYHNDGTFLNCDQANSDPVYFDGRDGPTVLTLQPGQTNMSKTQHLLFKSCGTAPPGTYTAQATIAIVGR